MLKTTLMSAAVMFAATGAFAETPPSHIPPPPDRHEPIPGKQDPRIRTFPFDPTNTLRLTTPGKMPALMPVRIIFGDGSIPETVAGAFVSTDPKTAIDWAATSAGNTLLMQPMHADIPPSIVFVTTKGGTGSGGDNYVIELHVGGEDITKPDTGAYLQVTYTYPAMQAAAVAEVGAKALRVKTESKVRTSLVQARFSAPRQWHYSKMGADCATMTPSGWNWISDDGSETSLLIPPHMAGSSIFSRESDDTKPEDESLITPISTTTSVGTLEVLPGVYKQLVLRRGGKVCALRADNYDPIGTQPGGGTGTISPDVIRTIHPKQAAR